MLAAWSAYAAETAVCYMSEFKRPGKDAPKAIIWSGIVCIALYVLVPFVFQGVLGTAVHDEARHRVGRRSWYRACEHGERWSLRDQAHRGHSDVHIDSWVS